MARLFPGFGRTRQRNALPRLESLEARACPSGSGWSMYGYDALGSRNNTAETTLSPANVGQLGVAWSYPTAAPVTGTPAVVEGSVYAGDYAGNVYSVNEANGRLNWEVNVGGSVSASILVTDNTVIFGDVSGNVWGLNASTGATKWEVQPNTSSPYGSVFGSATLIGKDVAIAFASNEENVPGLTTYQENGSLALLNPNNGHVIWETYAIPQAAYAAGWRGVGIWSTPTYDQATHTIYVGTGNYYQAGTGTDPGVEDAVMAFDSRNGALLWTDQLVKGDVWNGNIVPGPDNPDADLGDSPKIFTLPNGETAVGIGSKDGFYFVMDAATGQRRSTARTGCNSRPAGCSAACSPPGPSIRKTASSSRTASTGQPWELHSTPPVGGDLYAVSLDGNTLLWDFKTAAPNGSGVAIANGVVYFTSLDGTLYALNANAPDAADALLAPSRSAATTAGPPWRTAMSSLGRAASSRWPRTRSTRTASSAWGYRRRLSPTCPVTWPTSAAL